MVRHAAVNRALLRQHVGSTPTPSASYAREDKCVLPCVSCPFVQRPGHLTLTQAMEVQILCGQPVFDPSSANGRPRRFGRRNPRSNRGDGAMRGSYSGQYARVPLSIRGFESRTSLHVNCFCSSSGRARDPYSRDWRSTRHRSSRLEGGPLWLSIDRAPPW